RKLGIVVVTGLGMLVAAAIAPARAADDGDDPGLNNMGGGGLSSNALTPIALIGYPGMVSGSVLGDLNGVVLEAATLPHAAQYRDRPRGTAAAGLTACSVLHFARSEMSDCAQRDDAFARNP